MDALSTGWILDVLSGPGPAEEAMVVEVDGKPTVRPCYVDGNSPWPYMLPEVHEGEALVRTICGKMWIVTVRR